MCSGGFFHCSSRGFGVGRCAVLVFFIVLRRTVMILRLAPPAGRKGRCAAPLSALSPAPGGPGPWEKVSWGWCGCDLVPSLHPHALPIGALDRTVRRFLSDWGSLPRPVLSRRARGGGGVAAMRPFWRRVQKMMKCCWYRRKKREKAWTPHQVRGDNCIWALRMHWPEVAWGSDNRAKVDVGLW